MTGIESAFEEWLTRSDRTLEIDGNIYYRIVYSEGFNLFVGKMEVLCVVLSPDMPCGKSFEDENGNHFTFDGYHHIKFKDKVPEWYFESGLCALKWQETKEIGKYLKIIE